LISSANWGKGEGVKERKKKRKAIPPISFLFHPRGFDHLRAPDVETKKNEEDKKEKPPGVMEDGDISHHGNGNKNIIRLFLPKRA